MSKKKETKLSKYMKVPIKMVVKARDLYIQSMNQMSSHDYLGSGGGMAFGIPMVRALPRSFSANSARDKELRVAEKLVRSASARNMTVDHTKRGPSKLRKAKSLKSCGGIERIDERSPLVSTNNHKKKKMLQRCKSYGVVKYTYPIMG